MKKHNAQLVRRAAALALAVLTALPMALAVRAAEFSIDGSGFTNPTITVQPMYYWFEGLPPRFDHTDEELKIGELKGVPILITWEDKYYLCADSKFASEITKNSREGLNSISEWDTWISAGKYGDAGKASDYFVPLGKYHTYRQYNISSGALLQKQEVGESLAKYGYAVSMNLPEGLPTAVSDRKAVTGKTGSYEAKWFTQYTKYSSSKSASTQDRPLYKDGNYYALLLPEQSGKKYNWLVAKHYTALKGNELTVDEYLSTRTDPPELWFSTKTDRYYVGWPGSAVQDYHGDGPETFFLPFYQRCWNFAEDGSGYRLEIDAMQTGSHFGYDLNSSQLPKLSFYTSYPGDYTMSLEHSNGKLFTKGSALRGSGGLSYKSEGTDDETAYKKAEPGTTFKIYYAEKREVSFIQTSFRVQKGQVTNLDGPIVIGPNCTVTVEDGGMLSVSGWVVNNGEILVKPGGTLMVQEHEVETEDGKQYGAITTLEDDAGKASGRIACDGTMIIMPNCKVQCGGKYGLSFGESAQCINYGAIIAENLDVYRDHTIEMRGSDSRVFAGYGCTSSGYILSRVAITGTTYPDQGTTEKVAVVRLAKDAAYGEGASRVYYNTGHSGLTTTKDMANRKGSVSAASMLGK